MKKASNRGNANHEIHVCIKFMRIRASHQSMHELNRTRFPITLTKLMNHTTFPRVILKLKLHEFNTT